MYQRAKYKEIPSTEIPHGDDYVGTYKYDGANFFMPVAEDGSLRFFSRRESVKGGFPERTESLPHLTQKKMPQYAGKVFNVELIHTGRQRNNPESHAQVSGILNSLPPRAIATQQVLGPVRVVLHNVVEPDLSTYSEKLKLMKQFEQEYGNPEILFANEPHVGRAAIQKLVDKTKKEGREGVIVTHLTLKEPENPRYKIKHKIQHNLRVTDIIQEIDKDGNPKPSMGALKVVDATGREVGTVGSGFSRSQRIDAWKNPEKWMHRLIQVESMGLAANRLRSPIYNGDADGRIDTV